MFFLRVSLHILGAGCTLMRVVHGRLWYCAFVFAYAKSRFSHDLAHFMFLFSDFQLFQLALTVSVLYYGGHLVLTGKLTGGTLIAFILYQIQLGDCFNVRI